MKGYQAFLFDMDGTLVDSEPLKGLALALACQDFGASVEAVIYQGVMGENWQTVTGHFFRHAGISPDLDEFNQHFRTYYEALLTDRVSLNPGARDFIHALKAAGKQCAIVSSAATWMVEQILDDLQLNGLFDLVITQEHVSQHKPDPEAYVLALSRLNLSPHQALIFEDSEAGVIAGVKSGCEVIAFSHAFNGKNDLSQASRIISSYEDLRL
ncbi:HAD family hydrolase [Photobacterium galatheae]|uniref:Beta-phosphoglucomutase n=1 Tax=Photobacterium galatheae TaxID=1654360 RepID=A0A066RT49_9GAMM|nr:HAD family phosphatase [Photobacterium galatheae]KDM93534.1 beta-phosphoglucomutase [Photobacterium galatheae]MCM0151358.1 HAD family phosphatase [Photobacterium galatheae]